MTQAMGSAFHYEGAEQPTSTSHFYTGFSSAFQTLLRKVVWAEGHLGGAASSDMRNAGVDTGGSRQSPENWTYRLPVVHSIVVITGQDCTKFIPFIGHHLKLKGQFINLVHLLLLLSEEG